MRKPRSCSIQTVWSEDGTDALGGYYPDPSGRYVAYLVQQAGSDWRRAQIRDLQTGQDLPETLEWLKFTGLSWAADGSGFYYSRYPEPEGDKFHGLLDNHTVYFHRVGTGQDQDQLIYLNAEHPRWHYGAEVTEDGRYLLITVFTGTDSRYQVLAQEIGRDAEPYFLVEGFEHDYQLIGHVDGRTAVPHRSERAKGACDCTSDQPEG